MNAWRGIVTTILTAILFVAMVFSFSPSCPAADAPDETKAAIAAFHRGRTFFNKQDYLQALDVWEELLVTRAYLLKRDEQLSLAHNLAIAADRLGEQERAQRYAMRALRLDPTNKELHNLANKVGLDWTKFLSEQPRPPKPAADGATAASLRARGRYWYRRGQLTRALALFERAADAGDSAAQRMAARQHFRGEGTKVDQQRALVLMKQAAAGGDATAQVKLGEWYQRGIVAGRDLATARHWFGQAAAQGDVDGQTNLGVFLAMGWGGPAHPKRAVSLFRQAMKGGHLGAIHNLGNCYERGTGVERDITKAKEYYLLAAQRGHIGSRKAILRIDRQLAEQKALEQGSGEPPSPTTTDQ